MNTRTKKTAATSASILVSAILIAAATVGVLVEALVVGLVIALSTGLVFAGLTLYRLVKRLAEDEGITVLSYMGQWVGGVVAIFILGWVIVANPQPAESISSNEEPTYASSYDCGDFEYHVDAQAFFEDNHPNYDPYHLDRDNDGIACENLP